MPRTLAAAVVSLGLFLASPAQAQEFQRPPEFASTEVSAERALTFRVFAPKASAVRLMSSDLPSFNWGGVEMKKSDNGVWDATTKTVPAGAYRYSFLVDGLSVVDPRNPTTSETNSNSSSLLAVPGSDKFDLKDVPHGSVARLSYHSKSLNRFRRMHVYTPPGYDKGTEQLPVLYLLHGAMDCDASWSTIGQAGQILDNLIAAGKAKPMVVVMPMGHTGAFSFGPGGGGGGLQTQIEEFIKDFQEDIRPTIEARYRVSTERRNRALAGLSMGGVHTLEIGIRNLGDYGYLGIFSSGVFGMSRRGIDNDAVTNWETKNKKALEDPELKKGLRKVWFATGKEDFLIGASRSTVECFKKNGFDVTYNETDGGHTWLNWRDYLHDFAQLLFNEST